MASTATPRKHLEGRHQARLGALLWALVWAFFPLLVAVASAFLRSIRPRYPLHDPK